MRYDAFVAEVEHRTGLSEGEAAALGRATLRTLAERIPPGTAAGLAVALPDELAGQLLGGRTPGAEEFDICEFIGRVSERSGLDAPHSTYGARVVFGLIHGMAARRAVDAVREALSCDLRVLFDAGSADRPAV
ncbi:Uncharacterized conserved protein, DUF2267 family [Saccharopolyspora antimicrobica]|uniref:Uncharacterized conserved protein, DUF2267 family n=1 Tax=Saccharopolyspora antimicrobica TaxID=455193 RepID=A0A1I5KUK2_9PSEU|nr:DUF2267 domain-containing protein [Saccharopolyspora antimicrobica]RKT89124.1 uncharacterized protein (DUF2267 family) [Saccharopolyspora antimicrobica]SFO88562.1 Uncharacterized conserved protein, DUF2267 family [Saccharopolyspora antimicrobica]